MNKYILVLGSAMLLAMSFAACDAEDAANDMFQAPNPTVYEACMDFRAVACEKLVACTTFLGQTECEEWFDSDTGYEGCNVSKTNEMSDAATANFDACIAALPGFTNCAGLSDPGIEDSIVACDNWP